jgi:hypothetical protein
MCANGIFIGRSKVLVSDYDVRHGLMIAVSSEGEDHRHQMDLQLSLAIKSIKPS